jgi:hypothetical protein
MKNPTLKEKVREYERLLHAIQLHAEVTLNPKALQQLIGNVCRWSYAHRAGNGMKSEKQTRELVNKQFARLCDIENDSSTNQQNQKGKGGNK